VTFAVLAEADVGLLMRVLGVFAARAVTPDRVVAGRMRDGVMRIRVSVSLDIAAAQLVQRKLDIMPGIVRSRMSVGTPSPLRRLSVALTAPAPLDRDDHAEPCSGCRSSRASAIA
jgi:hypothetical protein